MSGQIFINYRRDDDPGFTALLRELLADKFAADQLFMDIDSIEPGLDFVRVLEEKVDKCDVFLAVIGPRWLVSRDEAGNPRLENPADFVRIEIESCLKLEKRLIPVLVNNADIPRPEHLPDSLKPLVRRNAVRLTRDRFKADAQGLIKALEKALEEVEANRLSATTAATAEANRREQEEATKAAETERQDKERARLQAIAGLSPEQIAKAEELANWDFIKESQSAQDFRDQLARFPKSVTERMARAKLEAIVWKELGELPQLEALEGFLTEFPDGSHAAEARSRLNELRKVESERCVAAEQERRELAAWNAVKGTPDLKTIQAFLQEWPNSTHAAEGRRLCKTLSRGVKSSSAGVRWGYVAEATLLVVALVSALILLQHFYGSGPNSNPADAGLARQPQPVYPSAENVVTDTKPTQESQPVSSPKEPKTAVTWQPQPSPSVASQPQPTYYGEPQTVAPSVSGQPQSIYYGPDAESQPEGVVQPQPISPSDKSATPDNALARQPQPTYFGPEGVVQPQPGPSSRPPDNAAFSPGSADTALPQQPPYTFDEVKAKLDKAIGQSPSGELSKLMEQLRSSIEKLQSTVEKPKKP